MLRALLAALRALLHPRMVALAVLPGLLALLFWGGLAILFRADLAAAIGALLLQLTATWSPDAAVLGWASAALAFLVAFALVLPLAYLTTVFVSAVFLMPAVVDFVAEHQHPGLAKRQGGNFWGSFRRGLTGALFFALLWLAALPLWLLFPPLAPVVAVLLGADLNRRVFPYDALAEHADADELRRLTATGTGAWFALGLAPAALALIPFLGLFSPLFAALAYAHHGLDRLAEARGDAHP